MRGKVVGGKGLWRFNEVVRAARYALGNAGMTKPISLFRRVHRFGPGPAPEVDQGPAQHRGSAGQDQQADDGAVLPGDPAQQRNAEGDQDIGVAPVGVL